MKTDTSRFWDGALYKLIDVRIPFCRTGRGQLSIAALASKMGYTSEGLYKYLRADRLSLDGAHALVRASEGKISLDDLLCFLPENLRALADR